MSWPDWSGVQLKDQISLLKFTHQRVSHILANYWRSWQHALSLSNFHGKCWKNTAPATTECGNAHQLVKAWPQTPPWRKGRTHSSHSCHLHALSPSTPPCRRWPGTFQVADGSTLAAGAQIDRRCWWLSFPRVPSNHETHLHLPGNLRKTNSLSTSEGKHRCLLQVCQPQRQARGLLLEGGGWTLRRCLGQLL